MSTLENVVTDKRADRLYVDVKGQLSNENHPDIFGPELLPGETILREFRVWTVESGRPLWKIILLSIFTLTLYACYIYICFCFRDFGVGNHRTRVAITNKGRMMLWDHDTAGTRQGGICPCFETSYTSVTNMEWFHVDDINSMQLIVQRESRCRTGPLACCGVNNRGILRVFFGKKYPKNTLITEYGYTDSGAIQGLEHPEWDRSKFLTGDGNDFKPAIEDEEDALRKLLSIFEPIVYVCQGLFHLVTCGHYYHPSNEIPRTGGGKGEFSLDLVSYSGEDWYDGYHEEDFSAWQELNELARYLSNAKDMGAPMANFDPNPEHFVMKNSSGLDEGIDNHLIEDKQVHIDASKFPLRDDERIIDAIQIQPRMSWWEFIFVWKMCCDRKYITESAAIVSTHRAFSVSEYRPERGQYEMVMTMFFFDKLGGGMIVTDPKGDLGYSIDVKTTYGALRVKPIMSHKWPWTPKVPAELKKRMYHFMYTFERACKTTQCIPAPASDSLPNPSDVQQVVEYINLWDGEELCSVVRSKNLYNLDPYRGNPLIRCCTCGDFYMMKNLVNGLTCGARPWRLDQFVVLTTHRVLAFQRIDNTCKVGRCQGKAKVLLWIPLTDVRAMRYTGSMNSAPASCLHNLYKDVLSWCNKDTATLTVAIGTDHSYHQAPFKIGRMIPQAKSGLIEGHPELKHFRAALAYYQSTRDVSTYGAKADPVITNEGYGKTPYPEYLSEEVEINNPMAEGFGDAAGAKPAKIGVGTTGA